MSTANRSAIFTKMHKVLRKHYEPVAPPSERTVLEHLLYACVLEHARHDAVDDVFARLQKSYFDWNEVRVTSVPELAEGMASIPDAVDAAKRLKRALQSVFETHYVFDIEFLKKQGLAKTIETVEKYSGVTPFIVAYLTQNALGGHAIPVNGYALILFVVVGAITEADAAKHRVPGLERAIPKPKGVEFGSLLQQFAVDFASNPQGTKVKNIIAEIDPQAKDRLPKKVARPTPPPTRPKPISQVKPPSEMRPPTPRPGDSSKAMPHPPQDKEPKPASKKERGVEPAESKKAPAARITRKKPK